MLVEGKLQLADQLGERLRRGMAANGNRHVRLWGVLFNEAWPNELPPRRQWLLETIGVPAGHIAQQLSSRLRNIADKLALLSGTPANGHARQRLQPAMP